MTENSNHRMVCATCGGTGVDPSFGDQCAPCGGTGYKATAVTMPAADARPSGPSDKQVAFHLSLVDQITWLSARAAALDSHRKGLDDTARKGLLEAFARATRKEASVIIDALIKVRDDLKGDVYTLEQLQAQAEAEQRRQQRAHGQRNSADVDGMYQLPDGRIVKVQYAVHGSGHPYAKLLTDQGEDADRRWTFEYVPGLMRECRPEYRMTLEQAKEFGALYGACCVCGRTLTNEVSIEAGIGPICSGRLAS